MAIEVWQGEYDPAEFGPHRKEPHPTKPGYWLIVETCEHGFDLNSRCPEGCDEKREG